MMKLRDLEGLYPQMEAIKVRHWLTSLTTSGARFRASSWRNIVP